MLNKEKFMNILKALKQIPEDKQNLKLFYFSPKEVFRITEISSEIVSFYEKKKDYKYQSIFFKYNSENIFKEEEKKSLTIAEIIEILENTINDNVTDLRMFYVASYDLVYEISTDITYNESGDEPCYVIYS
jgi:predicted RNA-binding protein with EMAP domain